MDNSFDQQELDTRPPGGFSASLQRFCALLKWLAGFIQLTEEEQKEAGIYPGDWRYK